MAQVRYIVSDVSEAVDFYVSKLGFEVEQQFGPRSQSWRMAT